MSGGKLTIADQIDALGDALDAELRRHLDDQSRAYGSVRGAINEWVSADRRGPDLAERAYRDLVAAIHAPREEALRLAGRCVTIARNIAHRNSIGGAL